MPVQPTYPGVYIVEEDSPVRTITGVSTGMTAFVGPAPQGPVNDPQEVASWADYAALFGGLADNSEMSAAVRLYFLNQGQQAQIVRVAAAASVATATLQLPKAAAAPDTDVVTLVATSPGDWANSLRARVDVTGLRPLSLQEQTHNVQLWNLTIHDTATGAEEHYANISTDPSSPQSAAARLATSRFFHLSSAGPSAPAPHPDAKTGDNVWDTSPGNALSTAVTTKGAADPPTLEDYVPSQPGADAGGIYALDKADIVNIMCVPDICAGSFDRAARTAALDACLAYCQQRRAMLIVDAFPEWKTVPQAVSDTMQNPLVTGAIENAAVYFPWITVADLTTGMTVPHPPSGAVAGVWARTDAARGVWKAPAGTDDGALAGVADLTVPLTDATIGELNPLGVNCLRRLPLLGPVVWGARTVDGADALASQWKYVPIRRLALFIEESLYRGTKWVVFEPNDEPLWSQIRLNVGAFMDGLFRQGAFQGTTRKDAYLVKCDAANNPQTDIDHGIVNILVGFAPLKPAEFVFIHIQQLSSLTTA